VLFFCERRKFIEFKLQKLQFLPLNYQITVSFYAGRRCACKGPHAARGPHVWHACCRLSYNNSKQDALFLNFISVNNSTCFGQIYCPSSGVLVLYWQQWVFVTLVTLTAC